MPAWVTLMPYVSARRRYVRYGFGRNSYCDCVGCVARASRVNLHETHPVDAFIPRGSGGPSYQLQFVNTQTVNAEWAGIQQELRIPNGSCAWSELFQNRVRHRMIVVAIRSLK